MVIGDQVIGIGACFAKYGWNFQMLWQHKPV
jgi:hypothetical protein